MHCDLKPANILLFYDIHRMPEWKLIDFDSAALVGEPVTHGTLDYCAPEAYTADDRATASFEMDMYSLGRIIHWLGCTDDNLWPGLPAGCSHARKEAFLISSKEFTQPNVPDAPTANIVKRLTRKQPPRRLTLEKLKATQYIKLQNYTKTIELKQ